MKEKYEFTFQMTFEDLVDITQKLMKLTYACRVQKWNLMLAFIGIMVIVQTIFISFFKIYNFVTIIPSFAVALLYYLYIAAKQKEECLKIPALIDISNYTFTLINIQCSLDKSLYVIPWKQLTNIETEKSFGFIFNISMSFVVPKRLFANQDEIDEFRLFVQQNQVKSSL